MTMNPIFRVLLCAVATALIAGCAADLSTGNKFNGFRTPEANKSLVYLLRDEGVMTTKLAYIGVQSATPNDKGEAIGQWEKRALIGKDMFVPLELEPGKYLFRNTKQTDGVIELKPNEVTCLDVGGKYRGITLFSVDLIESREECLKILQGKYEGVQLAEAQKRVNQ